MNYMSTRALNGLMKSKVWELPCDCRITMIAMNLLANHKGNVRCSLAEVNEMAKVPDIEACVSELLRIGALLRTENGWRVKGYKPNKQRRRFDVAVMKSFAGFDKG